MGKRSRGVFLARSTVSYGPHALRSGCLPLAPGTMVLNLISVRKNFSTEQGVLITCGELGDVLPIFPRAIEMFITLF